MNLVAFVFSADRPYPIRRSACNRWKHPLAQFTQPKLSRLLWLTVFPLAGLLHSHPVQAQSIKPAADGTQTNVTVIENRYDIHGGSLSSDGSNLFHSFQQFGLQAGEVANFLSTPQIRNILGRVVGGDASLINGLIQVTGGNSNLYLMNPAGMVFGANARLNVPAAFTATTANGMGFGNNWFNAVGSTDYATLTGAPTALVFTSSQPGAIINAGQLAVGSGQSLSLLGGVVINTGSLSAPEGQVTLAAISGEQLIRLSQPGSLLSFEIQPLNNRFPVTSTPSLSLAELLTGGNLSNATGITVNPDGSIHLYGSTLPVPIAPGTAIASGTLDVSSSLHPGGTIQVLGDRVGLLGATLQATGQNGGTVLIGGDYRGQGSIPNATFTYVSPDTRMTLDSLLNGNGGKAIVWANDSTRFYGTISAQGGPLGGNGGFIETSGKRSLDVSGATINASAAQGQAGLWLLDPRNVIIKDGTPFGTINNGINPLVFTAIADTATISAYAIATLLSSGTSVTITTGSDGTQAGNITIASSIIGSGSTSATFTLDAANDIIINSPIQASSAGWTLTLKAQRNIEITQPIKTEGGILNSNSSSFNSSNTTIFAGGADSRTGEIQIATSGPLAAGILNASASKGRGGAVKLTAGGNIAVNYINAEGATLGTGGEVYLASEGFIRVLGSFNATSISTIGGTGEGSITIKHGGGFTNTPFIVGNATINGTAAAISTSQTNKIVPTQSFAGNYSQGKIEIISPLSSLKVETQEKLANRLEGDITDNQNAFETVTGNPGSENQVSAVDEQDKGFSNAFEDHLDLPADSTKLASASSILNRVQALGVQPALIYASFIPSNVATESSPITQAKNLPSKENQSVSGKPIAPDKRPKRAPAIANETDQLELVVVTASGPPVRKQVAGATRGQVQKVVRQFITEITDPRKIRTTSYLESAQQLYRWLIAPIEPELKQRGISNLAYIADTGLRFIPLAALHDGQQFLVEKYSVGLMPSLNLTDTRYVSLKNAKVLAMGASKFTDQPLLPGVPIELQIVTQTLGQGKSFLNEDFTLQNLQAQRSQSLFQIVHLATHGEFQPGELRNSYIQLWNTKLRLDQLRDLRWNDPPIELLVLSACRTAFGSEEAELGFAGFAVQAGVKSALASLWYVSDEGTLGLMSEFYRQLKTAPIKAEALRQAQISMLRGEVQISGNQIRSTRGSIPLPPNLFHSSSENLSHPYYWASFTLIGSPW